MVDTASIVIAIIGLVGAAGAAIFTGYFAVYADQRKERLEIKTQVRKYSDPLIIAAHDLQERLWELLETDTTYHDTHNENGKENINVFTCYLIAQFLAWAHILKTKAQYLSFNEDKSTSGLRRKFWQIGDELATCRYDETGWIFRLWPGHQLGIAENMTAHITDAESPHPLSWSQFKDKEVHQAKFEYYFRPMKESIRQLLDAKYRKKFKGSTAEIPDQRLRRLQHLLVDLVVLLDTSGQVQEERPLRRCGSARECDCENRECNGEKLKIDRWNRKRNFKEDTKETQASEGNGQSEKQKVTEGQAEEKKVTA